MLTTHNDFCRYNVYHVQHLSLTFEHTAAVEYALYLQINSWFRYCSISVQNNIFTLICSLCPAVKCRRSSECWLQLQLSTSTRKPGTHTHTVAQVAHTSAIASPQLFKSRVIFNTTIPTIYTESLHFWYIGGLSYVNTLIHLLNVMCEYSWFK